VILQEPTLCWRMFSLCGASASASIVSRPKPPQRLAIYYGLSQPC
jgi:hypothetical protein